MALLLPKPPTKKDPATRGGADKDDKQKEAIIDTAATVESIDKTLFGFTGFFNKKQNKKFQQKQEMYQRKALKIQEQQNDGGKDKKSTKKWRKVVDFLYGGVKGLFKAVGAIVKSLSLSKATGLLGLLLGIFLMLKLGLLDIVLPAALDLFLVLIKELIKFLPKILESLWTVVSEYIPKIISAIADSISDALGIKSKTGKKTVKLFTTIGAGLLALGKILSVFGGGLSSLASFLLANPIALAIAALIAELVAIWVYAEEISDFFDGLWEKFKKLGIVGKILIAVFLTPLLLTIGQGVLIVAVLAKLFKSFKKIGVAATFKAIWESITTFFSNFGKAFKEGFMRSFKIAKLYFIFFSNMVKSRIKKFISDVIGGIRKFVDDVKKKFINIKKNIERIFFAILVKVLINIFKIIKKIKNLNFPAVFQNIWTGISSFFKKMMGGIIEKFKPIKEFFTSIGKKIGDFFEPAIRKIKLLVSTIGDVFGSIIDWILYTVAPLIPGLDRGAAKSAEEYRLVSYASKQASDTDSRGRIEQYAKAKMRGDKARMNELAEQMTASQQALATSMAGSGMANLESYSNRLKQGGDFLTSRTKIFGTPVNNSASL